MHHPSIDKPATTVEQESTAVTELCKAHDHLLEALYLFPEDSFATPIVGRMRLELKRLIHNASNGRVSP